MKKIVAFVATLVAVLFGAGVNAQQFPTKPVTLYIPFAAGGGTDLSFRMLEEAVSKNLGQKLLIVNKTGTNTVYQVVTGTPDGYSLTVGSPGNLAAVPHNPGAPYKRDDYIPVIQLTYVPCLLIVPPNSPYNGLAAVVGAARKNPPGFIKVGVTALGSISHLAVLQLEKAFNVKFTYIPHKSNGDVVTAVLGGHIDVGSADIAAAAARLHAKTLSGIALYSNARLPDFPDVPTVKEQGADITFGFYNMVIAPKGTPERIVMIIHDAFKKALEDPAVIERAKSLAIPIAYLGPKASRQEIDNDYERFGKLLAELGLKK